jgi:predicted esterase
MGSPILQVLTGEKRHERELSGRELEARSIRCELVMDRFPAFTGSISERIFTSPVNTQDALPDHDETCDPAVVGNAYIAFTDRPDDGHPSRVVLALHGSGRNAGSYREIPFYRYQRDRALRSGYIFASISNGLSGWGLDEGLERVLTLITVLRRELGNKTVFVPWGSSAGGAMTFRLIQKLADEIDHYRIARAIGTFPLYDVKSVFEISSGCARAWNAENTIELDANLGDRNPPNHVEKLSGCTFWIGHGIDDVVVSLEANAARLQREVSALGGKVILRRSAGGHSTENSEVYDDESLSKFLES